MSFFLYALPTQLCFGLSDWTKKPILIQRFESILQDAPRATAEVPHVTPSPSMPTPYWSANQWGMPGERSAQGSQVRPCIASYACSADWRATRSDNVQPCKCV